jgi:adenosylcobinamide amidohydrolase
LEDFTGGGFRRQMPAGYDKFDRVNEEFDEEDEPLPQTKKRASAEIAQNIMAAAPAAAAAAAVPKSAKAVADVDMKNKNHMAGQRYKIGTVNIPKKLKDAMHTILKGS